MIRTFAIVPALDEAASIGRVVDGLLRGGACCVTVVDGGSHDATIERAAAAGARVVPQSGRGYGAACLTGARLANTDHKHEAVAFLDGDGSCDPADLPGLLHELADADLVLGRRDPDRREAGAVAWHASLGNALVARLIQARTGRLLGDLPPFKAVRTSLLERLALDETGYGWTVQLIARSLVHGIRVAECPVSFRRRQGGVSKVSGSTSASVRAGLAMLRTAWRETRRPAVVALVAKAPRSGNVKTRLGVSVGDDAAAELWEACLRDAAASLLAAANQMRARPLVVVPSASEAVEVSQRIGHAWEAVVQPRTGLDGAILAAFAAAAAHGADRAIVVSGDNPDLPPEHAVAALAALRHHDAVLGPTLDGGYHLIGLRLGRSRGRRSLEERLVRAFGDLPLGGAGAAEVTRRSLQREGWHPVDVAGWPDLDTLGDLQHAAQRLQRADAAVAPATRAWLASHASVLARPSREGA